MKQADLIYHIGSGDLTSDDSLVGRCYSGNGVHKNDVRSIGIVGHGPIPVGRWRVGVVDDSKGPWTVHLQPHPSTQTFGRSGFAVHGDSARHPGQASAGCIVASRYVRRFVSDYPGWITVIP
jgi:hypothetical protein